MDEFESNSIKVITKTHGSFKVNIDQDLQKTNPLTTRGIFLVKVNNGIVWGYDSEKYMYDDSNQIIRKKIN